MSPRILLIGIAMALALSTLAIGEQHSRETGSKCSVSEKASANAMLLNDALEGTFGPPNVATISKGEGQPTKITTILRTDIGKVKARSSLGNLTLKELLSHPKSHIYGWLVIQNGTVVYEEYPEKRTLNDSKKFVWMSTAKTIVALLVNILEEKKVIDVQKAIDLYMQELINTNWHGIKVRDILDMASGLDFEETGDDTKDQNIQRLFDAERGNGSYREVLLGFKKRSDPGRKFEYSSANTQMLGMLIESASHRDLADLFREWIWSKIGAEEGAILGLTPEGQPIISGMLSSRLRDMGRYGMLYTPSWSKTASENPVSQNLLQKIQGGRPELYVDSAVGKEMAALFGEQPHHNSYQWDAVFADGDFYKAGYGGQGLYISPSRDLVIAWFSATNECGFEASARAIAKYLTPPTSTGRRSKRAIPRRG